MNRVATAPIRAASYALRASGSFLLGVARKSVTSLSLVPTYLSGLLWLLSQQFLDLAQNGYGGNAAVFSCLNFLCQSVGEPPLLPYLVDADGETGQPLPYTHPLRQLIRQPNELTSEFEFWELTTLYLNIAGRANWWKERDRTGRVIALWPLRPDRVGPIYSTSDKPGEHVIQGWSYLVPGSTTYLPLPRRDVLTFTLPNPAGDSGGLVEGLAPLQVLAAEVGADNEATRFVGALVANHAMPGIVITTKNTLQSYDEAQLIKAAFIRDHGGVRRGEPAVVDGDATITPFGFNLQQLEFPDLRDVSESRIAAAFRTPAILVGLRVGLQSGIKATTGEQRAHFTETTLASYWRRYGDTYSNDVASEFGPGLVCRFDLRQVKALAEQMRNEALQIERAFELGTVTINEYREAVLKLPKLPNGDVRILPRGTVEIDGDNNVIGTAPPPTVDDMGAPGEAKPKAGQNGHGKAKADKEAVASGKAA